MSGLTADTVINLDEDVDVKASNLSDAAAKKNLFLVEILEGKSNIEIVINCEGCGRTLDTPIMLTYSAGDDNENKQRDTSILCDANCVE